MHKNDEASSKVGRHCVSPFRKDLFDFSDSDEVLIGGTCCDGIICISLPHLVGALLHQVVDLGGAIFSERCCIELLILCASTCDEFFV